MCVDDVSVSNQPHCLTVVFSACFYVSGDLFGLTFSPRGGTATEQAGTAPVTSSFLARSSEKFKHCEKKSQTALYVKKGLQNEIHLDTQNNTKQNRAAQKPGLRGDREVKYEIKNGPPRAQGKLSAPTPQDSTDNSPSAP